MQKLSWINQFNLSVFRALFFFSIVGLLISSCKSSRRVADASDQTFDSVLVQLDTPVVVLDTIVTVQIQDSVEIPVYRLLKDTLTIVGVGDMMLGTNFPNPGYLPPDSGKNLLKDVLPYLQNADVTFGNLEGVILNDGGNAKYCRNPDVCYIFRSPEYMAQRLLEAGFDVVSTANNHAGDFGDPGRKNTIRVLDSLQIAHTGLVNTPYTIIERDGMTYGITAFAPNTGTQSIHNYELADSIVSYLDSKVDVVIVSFHGGAEGSKYEHVTRETERFYGENRGNVYEFSHRVIDAGADIVFGHGPHVTRAIEVYKERIVAYSLGNFCTYARFNLRDKNGLAPILKVHTDAKGKFLKGEIIPVVQYAPGGPVVDSQKRVIKVLQKLIAEDFPEAAINIDDSGLITYIQR